MKMRRALLYVLTLVFTVFHVDLAIAQATDPLPSWTDGNTKGSILAFVDKVTTAGSPDFVPPAERIATFDNDGTLWAEKPVYFQLLFALDRVKELAPQHPEWKDKEPFASLLEGNVKSALAGGDKALLEIVMAPCAHDDCRVREDREGLDQDSETPDDEAPLHRDGPPADA